MSRPVTLTPPEAFTPIEELAAKLEKCMAPRRVLKRAAKEWPAPGLYDFNELLKLRFPDR